MGPISIAEKSNGAAQVVEAYNVGDGTLNLQVASNVSWAAAAIGSSRPCTSRSGACLPVQIQFKTASLAKGIYTGFVTVSDAKAVDAPQSISVTAQIGGSVPDRVELFVAPGGTAESRFNTNSAVRGHSAQNWLSLALDGTGSFRFDYPYRIRATPGDLSEGSYSGSMDISGSSFAPDNKTIAVSMQVTSQPIAQAAPNPLRVRYAQGTAKQTRWLVLSNAGQGALAISSVSLTGSPSWLSLGTPVGLYVPVVIDVGATSPGTYRASVVVNTNGANGSLTVPVELEVVPQSAPVVTFGGVVNNATFLPGAVAKGDLVAIFGEQFLYKDATQAPKLPLTEELSGVRVLVSGRGVPVYYVSYGQINFQMPFDMPPGPVEVQVERDGQKGNLVSAEVAERAPRLLRLGIGDYGIVVNQDYTFPIPVTAGIASHPAHVGDVLTIYATGLGPTVPEVASGAGAPGAEPLARVVPPPTVFFSTGFLGTTISAQPAFVGLTPNYVGLYQINVAIPEGVLPGREISIQLDFGGGIVSSKVNIAVE